LDEDPTDSGAGFAGVFAAALANGGSFGNIKPGITFFKALDQAGNYVPTFSTAATIASGQVKVSIDWSYLNAAYAKALKGRVDWKVLIPASARYAAYYAQAISKDAPHPAAARLWEEFLYSSEGQNLWLKGYSLPVELTAMIKNGTVNKSYLAAVPAVSGTTRFPTTTQVGSAEKVELQDWPSVG
jgi:putative spermidine/putrescine transport system substrate-binding protein